MSEPLVGSTVLMLFYVYEDQAKTIPADATSIDLVIQDPDGAQSPETPTHISTGVYGYYLPLTAPGWWYAIWTATSGDLVTPEECGVCAGETILVGA
jgi:hypothetical protein